MAEFGDRIKELRIKAGETQEEFGNRFGLSRSQIKDIETGRTKNANLNFVREVAIYCNTDYNYILGYDIVTSNTTNNI